MRPLGVRARPPAKSVCGSVVSWPLLAAHSLLGGQGAWHRRQRRSRREVPFNAAPSGGRGWARGDGAVDGRTCCLGTRPCMPVPARPSGRDVGLCAIGVCAIGVCVAGCNRCHTHAVCLLIGQHLHGVRLACLTLYGQQQYILLAAVHFALIVRLQPSRCCSVWHCPSARRAPMWYYLKRQHFYLNVKQRI